MTLTIFTPTYNRKKMLDNLYHSLLMQSNKDFEWLIVDDGSVDGTDKQVNEYISEGKINISYIYQKNGGKHVAHNTGLANCQTDLFFCVDSDDELTPDAVDSIYDAAKEYNNANVLGYYFRKQNTVGEVSGGEFEIANNMVGLREIYYRYNFPGELAIVFNTAKVKNCVFPVFDDERFVSEFVFYNQITDIAPMVWIDKVIYIYEYQAGGYTQNAQKLMHNNPKGSAAGFLSHVRYSGNFLTKLKSMASFWAIIKVYNIDANIFSLKDVSFVIKILSMVFIKHYVTLFEKNKRVFEGD